MINSIKSLYNLLTLREKIHALLLLIVMMIAAVMEMLSLAAFLPLLMLLSDVTIVEGDSIIAQIYQTGWVKDVQSFFIYLAIIIFMASFLRIFVLFLSQYAITKYSLGLEHRWSVRLLSSYLHRPYEFFVYNNSAKLGNFVLQEVGQAISSVVNPILNAISKTLIIIALVSLVIANDPFVASILVLNLFVIYSLSAFVILRPLQRRGKRRVEASNRRFKYANEAIRGIKEAKLGHLEDVYAKRFGAACYEYISQVLFNTVAKMVPRSIAELTLIASLFSALIVSITLNVDGLSNVLPTIGIIALVALRLLPAAQLLYDSIHTLAYNHAAILGLTDGLVSSEIEAFRTSDPRFKFENSLEIRSLNYQHKGADKFVLQDFSLEIKQGQQVGITGETGAGKSTLLDIILGLRSVQSGDILADGQPIVGDKLVAWQSIIGYVPQAIYLVDDTIAANVALGEDPSNIDLARVDEVCKLANLDTFISKDLPEGYHTLVGDNGIKLSGGQRQRLGIARALYKRPQVMVLDEATSALDVETEAKVMENLRLHSQGVTMIMVAHRLSTLDNCDKIIRLTSK